MRLGCLLPLLSLGLIIGGGQSIYTGFKNRKVTEITIDSLIAKKPDAEWLRIQGGVLDTMNSSYTSSFGVGKANELYIPLVPPQTDSRKTQIHVLVLTKDPALLEFNNQVQEIGKSGPGSGAMDRYVMSNLDKLHVARPVEGVVQFGLDADDKKTRKIRELYDNLAPDTIILEEGKKPSMGTGIAMMIGGLFIGGLLIRSSGRKDAAGEATPPPLPPQ
ncbi:MAG: hypothetical protein ABIS50_24670 [Luteolibacter sp.]|uniref:hypothetical protein n=1 Tax=Luteolibacter sp. TaxID=1962973 RepID=UPI00326692C9